MRIGRIYSLLVIKGGIQPDYFFDKMSWQEVKLLIEELEKADRTSWEQTRMITHAIYQSQSKKRIIAQELIPFAWDKKTDSPELTQADIDEFKKRNNL